MITLLYLVVTLGILILQGIQHQHRQISLLGVLHSGGTLLITLALILMPGEWPAYDPLFRVDHLSLFLMLITSIVFTCASIYAVGYIDGLVCAGELDRRSLRIFYLGFSLLLLVTTMALYAPNMAQFWIFAELTTVFSALLVAILAVRDTIDASLKYVFVCSTSMLFSFIGVIFFFELMRRATGTGSLDWQVIRETAPVCDSGMLGIACIFFFIGFAAKSGIVPLHTWLPEAHAKAPSAVSAVLSGAILNVGMYGLLRMVGIVNGTSIAGQTSLLLLVFGMITMSVACFSMLRQTNLKKLIAFSSVENMGFLLLGAGIGSPVALFWVLFHMMGHSFVKSGLFFSAGILHRQYRTPGGGEDRVGDIFKLQPFAGGALFLGSIAIIGTPLFPIFLSKFGILIEAGKVSPYIVFISLLLFAIATVGLFRFLLTQIGEQYSEGESPAPYIVPGWMRAPVIFLLLLSIFAGMLMIPGEEEFLLSAVRDLGVVGGIL
ncbi:MAG TPA: proton-conducting transporter membrane subunit [Methanospirillum sp.]|nr:proton-conducting transporter membrane subunit [Methanospirillum sp.]